MPKDPVCKMDVDESTDFVSEYKGKTYHFCCAPCKETFDKKPEKYVESEGGCCCGR